MRLYCVEPALADPLFFWAENERKAKAEYLKYISGAHTPIEGLEPDVDDEHPHIFPVWADNTDSRYRGYITQGGEV